MAQQTDNVFHMFRLNRLVAHVMISGGPHLRDVDFFGIFAPCDAKWDSFYLMLHELSREVLLLPLFLPGEPGVLFPGYLERGRSRAGTDGHRLFLVNCVHYIISNYPLVNPHL